MPILTKPQDYLEVIMTRRNELRAQSEGKPFSEAILECCDIYLRLNEPPKFQTHANATHGD